MIRLLPTLGGLAILCAVNACKEEESRETPDGKATNPLCAGDYSEVSAGTPSLEHDLMPIFGASCVFSSCHDPSAKKADLMLGDPRSYGPNRTSCYDAVAEWRCSIPTPIDPNLLAEVRKELLAPSKTNPSVPRVTPGDPGRSFLLDKVTGTQNDRGYTDCRSQDPDLSPSSCGDVMPYRQPSLCTDRPDKVDAIAAWIRDGAPLN